MVIARGIGDNGKDIILIGLSDRNVDLLREGRPIYKESLSVIAMPESALVILHGTTEAEIVEELKRQGIRIREGGPM